MFSRFAVRPWRRAPKAFRLNYPETAKEFDDSNGVKSAPVGSFWFKESFFEMLNVLGGAVALPNAFVQPILNQC